MRAIRIIFRRELGAYLRSPFSWVLAALFLLLMGILFQAFGLGDRGGAQLSAMILERYFSLGALVAMGGGMMLSFRLISEERQNHSIVLLNTSPVRDSEIILGKFLAAFAFLAVLLALTLYIPLMLKSGNKITYSQIFVGYFGLLLAGATALAIGLFASSLTKYMLVAGVIALVILVVVGNLYQFGKRLDGTPRDVFTDLDLYWTHFAASFQRGILNLKDIVYYLAVIYFFLLLSVKTLEAKRWQ
ncbi:MAG: ABC transporter permease subunit [Kofleriaceae bacterium]